MSDEHRTPWDLIKEKLAKELSAESYQNWILRARFAGVGNKTLTVSVPDEGTAVFLEDEYGARINALARVAGDRY